MEKRSSGFPVSPGGAQKTAAINKWLRRGGRAVWTRAAGPSIAGRKLGYALDRPEGG
jgi:hypothetical protein